MLTSVHIPQCQHIRCNGLRCGSPALRGKNHCHYHTSLRAIQHQTELAQVEDATSIQVALMQVIRGISRGTWDTRTSALLLYGLQIASSNYPHVHDEAPLNSTTYHLPDQDELDELDECDDPSQELNGGKLPPSSVPEASPEMDSESKGVS
jgi:hypothetical protein